MNAAVPFLVALTLPGCLTTVVQSTSVERRSTGLETLADPHGEHLRVEEVSTANGVVELAVSMARRELEVESFEISEVTTKGRGWKNGGKAGRNMLWLTSAAAGWVGAFGVSWETDDGRQVQIGGLGADAQSWQGVVGLVAALGGIGAGTQQTLAVRRLGASSSSKIVGEQLLLGSKSVALTPLVGQVMELGLGGGGKLTAATDGAGHAALSGLSLPTASWGRGLDLSSEHLRGSWQPSAGLRRDLLALPADWLSPFHSSLLREVTTLAREAEASGGGGGLHINELTTPDGARARLDALPADQQALQAQAWIDQLQPLAEAAASQRERIHLDWLRGSSSVARETAASVGASLAMGDLTTDTLSPLFGPFELFRQLPEDVLIPIAALARPVLGPSARGVVLLEAGPCAVSDSLSTQPAGRALVQCGDTRVLIASDQDLQLAAGRAWVVVGLLDAPLGLRQGDATIWLPVVRPLYAATLAVDTAGQAAFTQVLDEEALLGSGVLRRLGWL